jgi:hypothetical protein
LRTAGQDLDAAVVAVDRMETSSLLSLHGGRFVDSSQFDSRKLRQARRRAATSGASATSSDASQRRAEIELMLKAERLGQSTHFETQIDERIAELAYRLAALERPHA